MQLPHGVTPSSKRGRNGSNGTGSNSSVGSILSHIIVGTLSFFLGTLTTLYAGLDCSSQLLQNHVTSMVVEQAVQTKVKEIRAQLEAQQQELINQQVEAHVKLVEKDLGEHCSNNNNNNNKGDSGSCHSSQLFPLDTMGRFAMSMARVPKLNFTNIIDPGVPYDEPKLGGAEVLMLYGRKNAQPTKYIKTDITGSPLLQADEALENCEYLHVVLNDQSGTRKQCLAIVPQYESFHVFNFMRAGSRGLDAKAPLVQVSRGYTSKGHDFFGAPTLADKAKHWDFIQTFMETIEDVKAELSPILKEIAVQNTVIVMVCNFGQSELLMNFVCNAKSRNLDISSIIVFTTDQETSDLAESLGLRTYYDYRVCHVEWEWYDAFECKCDCTRDVFVGHLFCATRIQFSLSRAQQNFGDIPAEAAKRYGDRRFVAMMMAKVICVQLVSMLGYDFLFQDVDIVWYSNPLDYFHNNPVMRKFDAIFQDDGGHSVRYSPFSANSGFYYIRNNRLTQHFMTSLLMAGDVIIATNSHQQAMIAVLNEQSSLYGLKVKVLSRDMEEFPGGFQWNQKSGKYMKALFAGEIHPIIFHMSWTLNKDNKLLYFRQMGEWMVKDQCIQQKKQDILSAAGDSDLVSACCAAEPLVSCHYRDKPSKIPCPDSPNIDKGKPSFW